jgi:hypothetical protein
MIEIARTACLASFQPDAVIKVVKGLDRETLLSLMALNIRPVTGGPMVQLVDRIPRDA